MEERLRNLLPLIGAKKNKNPSFSCSPEIARILGELAQNPDLKALSNDDFEHLFLSKSPAALFLKQEPQTAIAIRNEKERRMTEAENDMFTQLPSVPKTKS